MTDEQQPAEKPASHGDPGMPSAGRRPAADGPTVHLTPQATSKPAEPDRSVPVADAEPVADAPPHAESGPAGDEDEPTVATPVVPADDEATMRLTALPEAAGDEPPRPRIVDDGETVRLQRSRFAPETDGPVVATPTTAPEPLSASPTSWPARDAAEPEDVGSEGRAAGGRAAGGRAAGGQAAGGQGSGSADEDAAPGSEQSSAAPKPGISERPTTPAAGPGQPEAESPESVIAPAGGVPEKPEKAPSRRISSAGALIWVLLALLGFTLVVQLRSNDADAGLATARQEDLVGILSDLEARDQRLQQEINGLEESQRQLTSGVAGREAALAEADKRADELGLLAGTLPARGPGLKISIDAKGQPIKASAILNAVQELRGAGGEVMEIVGNNGVAVRIVASSSFVDAEGGEVVVDGKQLSGPYTLWVIGVPATMQTALQIPGGVVASVSQAGGNVTMEQRSTVEVTAVRQPTSLQYARPVS